MLKMCSVVKSIMKTECVFILICAMFLGSTHGYFISNGVPCSDKRQIIDIHNSMRKQLATGSLGGQPEASNMQKIVWDDRLQKLAQRWADNMEFKHNQNRKDSRFSVGENIFVSYSTSSDESSNWSQALYDWFNEYKIYKFRPLVSDPKTGHYTQIVWADTLYVGCGFTLYKEDGMLHKLYVCNYGPTGNYLGEYPYSTGPGCENLCCKNQCEKPYGNSCA